MSQIITKFIKDKNVTAAKIGSGAATAAQALFADASGGAAFRSILATDIPTLNQNTTGTAANITATSNATLTTLSGLTSASSLSISGSQVTGGTFGAVNGSALTNLAAANLSGVLPVGVSGGSGLSIATSQLTGTVSLAQMANIADGTILGNNSGSSAAPIALSVAQINAMLPVFTRSLNGLVPASGGTVGVTKYLREDGSWAAPAGATSGTVTSVALSDASATPIFSISGSPVTSSGTLTQTLNTQAANKVFAGPTTGSAAEPTFRSLVIADLSFAGAASGVATLDAGGKIPVAQLPNSVMTYEGTFNATTGSPALADGTGNAGMVYLVSVAGSYDFGAGAISFALGDWAVYNGSIWEKSLNSNAVVSVNGATGPVALSMASANGFSGSYTGTALTVSTTITGLLKGNGTAISAASPGTDYVIPSGSITGTAANITDSSNSTLTTLSALSLPTSQLSGNIGLTTQVTGILPIANGGTGQSTANAAFAALSPMTANGDLITRIAGVPDKLAIGSTGQVLTVVAGLPAWAATAATAVNAKETVDGSTIVADQITLAHTAKANSVNLTIAGAGDQLEGIDYTVSGAVITFIGDLAAAGAAALASGDKIQVQYEY